MTNPSYLVQTADGIIHAYWSAVILQCDLHANAEESVTIFKMLPGLQLRYGQVSREEIMAIGKAVSPADEGIEAAKAEATS